MAGIARITKASQPFQDYVNKKSAETPRQIKVSDKPKGKLSIECDEMWSWVGNKENQQWIRLALDTKTREIVGLYVGERSRESAKQLWKSLPTVYRRRLLYRLLGSG